jgi:hypothetical protein
MNEMTDHEAAYWDDYYTNNTIMPDVSKPGYVARTYGMPVLLDPETTRTLAAYAESVQRTPAQIVGELVRKELRPA